MIDIRRPSRGPTPLWWLVQRCASSLLSRMGVVDPPPSFPQLPACLGPLGHYFYVYAFLAVLPQVRALHRSRGIPESISRLTLADLGRQPPPSTAAGTAPVASTTRAGSRCTFGGLSTSWADCSSSGCGWATGSGR